ncbi:MAG: DNA polymerase III subunit chi [Rhodobacter sp.]|nr:DNA polymerase III subunit chi [Rhodobacter sp.]
MGEACFYHLTQAPLETTLPMLLDRARAAGWRVLVRTSSDARADWLDQKLWLGPDDGFLPHGRAGGPFDADQPVLLAAGGGNPTGAGCLMAVDGADVSPQEVTKADRVCILFDGNDPDAVNTARGQWKALTAAGCAAQYWSQDSGRWQKKAEHAGASGEA